MSYNLCGECSACCSVHVLKSHEMEWRDTDKIRHELCDQWSGGCTIYNKRPQACRNYECLWLKLKKLTEEYTETRRPNEIGFVVSPTTTEDGRKYIIDELHPGSLDLENMTTEQSDFIDEIVYMASIQKEKVKVVYRSYDSKTVWDLEYLIKTDLTQEEAESLVNKFR